MNYLISYSDRVRIRDNGTFKSVVVNISLGSFDVTQAALFRISAGIMTDDGVSSIDNGLLLEIFPEFDVFVRLHHCDINGCPIHVVENSMYLIERAEMSELKRMLNCCDAQANRLLYCEKESHIKYMIESFGLIEKWRGLANKGIALLERLTCKKVNLSIYNGVYSPLTIQSSSELNKLFQSGYYELDKVEERRGKNDENNNVRSPQDIKDHFLNRVESARQSAEDDYNILRFMSVYVSYSANWVYKEIDNQIVFNVRNKGRVLNDSELQDIMKLINSRSDLPDGLTIKNKRGGKVYD